MLTALSGVSLNDLQPSTGTGAQLNTPGTGVPKQAPAPVPALQPDTVKLSVTQQVRNLHSEGEGPGQIANSLGLTSTQVTGDLYVSLTWPQLLSKVASSTLTLGSSSDEGSSPTAVVSGSAPLAAAASVGQSDSSFSGVPAFGAARSDAALSGVPAFGAAKSDAALSGIPAFGAAKSGSSPGVRAFGFVAEAATTDAVAA